MRSPITPYLFNRLAGQLLALFVLYFALAWLLPIVGATLFNGMLLWSHMGILYCWCIQYAFIAVSVELRDTLVNKSNALVNTGSPQAASFGIRAGQCIGCAGNAQYVLAIDTNHTCFFCCCCH